MISGDSLHSLLACEMIIVNVINITDATITTNIVTMVELMNQSAIATTTCV